MPNACAVQFNRYNQKSSAYCETEAGDLIPPGMRLLLNNNVPKQIAEIQSNQVATAWENATLDLLKDEDAFTKTAFITIHGLKKSPADFDLYVKKGHALMPRDVRLQAGTLNIGTPDVDISQRTPPAESNAPHTGVHNVHRLYLSAAFRLLLGKGGNTGVAALIVSSRGEILAWGKKNGDHPLLHAETSALLMYGKRLPVGARIYSTLKPCKMCRAAIEHFSTGDDFLAYYGQDDQTAAASGRVSPKFVYMTSSNSIERPIWADNKKGVNRLLRTSVAQNLHNNYTNAHDKNWKLGIIDFIKNDDRQNDLLGKAASYLEVKQAKYTDPTLSEKYNTNVQKCLVHITDVMKHLGIPLPPRK
jgi:tRNA(Arg) A34 adenosine deaminase TadA